MTEIRCRLHFHETPNGSQRERERTEEMQGQTKMEGVRHTKLIEVSFYVGVHDLKRGRGGIPIPTEINAYK